MSTIQLIIGLGNPGDEYANTRHNAGVWFVTELAQSAHTHLRHDAKYLGKHALAKIHNQPCHLFVPSTFMNQSGQAIRAVSQYYKIPPQAMLIVHDEIDLPTGVIRLKYDGGDGGHNGLKDIIRHLQTKQFYRLRIGVGRPHPGHDVADYVLNAPNKADRHNINIAMEMAHLALPLMLEGHMQKAMQQLHTNQEE